MLIFPGTSYGFLEFVSLESAVAMMTYIKENNIIELKYTGCPPGSNKAPSERMRTTHFFYSTRTRENLKKFEMVDVPNASLTLDIPGMYIIDDFITEEEE